MRIVIATGIYPPEIGGPALYAEGVHDSLERMGHAAPVVLFGGLKKLPSGLRHLLYAGKLLWAARGAGAIFAFDTYSTGVPATLVGLLLRIPVVVRVGGDFVWESYTERTGRALPLTHFYENVPRLGMREHVARALVGWMLRHAEFAFNTPWLLEIWQKAYGFPRWRARVIENAIGARIAPAGDDGAVLLYGRSLSLKNARALRRAYALARKRGLPLSLEERQVPHEQLLERISRAHAVAVPSLSDVAPNTVIDALRCGKPFLLTKYSGYAERFKEYGVIVDPLSEEDMARGLLELADEKTYKKLCAHIAKFTEVRTFDDVTRDLLAFLLPRDVSACVRVLQVGSDRARLGVLHAGSPAFKRQEAYAKCFGALDIIGFSLKRDGASNIGEGSLRVYPTSSLSKLLYLFDARRIAKTLPRPDVVSAQDPFEAGLAAWLIARYFRVPLHVQMHTDPFAAGFATNSLLNRLRLPLARFVLKRARGVRVVSGRVAEALKSRWGVRVPVAVLPLYFDVARFRDAAPDPALEERFVRFSKVLLYVGRLEPEKNVALALRSFASAIPADACLIVLGEGSERAALEGAARDLGIADHVFFEGVRDPASYYKLADLVLLTSRYEGYPAVVVEALAAGTPVLSTDVATVRDVGAIVAPPEQFAGALKEWFASGSRTGELKDYPYGDIEEYVRAYCESVVSCITGEKGHTTAQ